MKIVFAGTPVFAASALQALMDAGHEIVLVLTQPDRPAGRGMKLTASAVKMLATAKQLPVYQPEKLRTEAQQAPLRELDVDVMVVAAYGLILPQAGLDLPRFGCLNIHASCLPRWRGAAPIQRAIEAGDAETGIAIMQMNAGLDTGDILSLHPLAITGEDTSASLHDKLAALGAVAIVDALANLAQLQAMACPQPQAGVSYAEKILKSEALIDWSQSATILARRVRAFNPFPGMQSHLGSETIKFWRAFAQEGEGRPGEIIAANEDGLVIACGEGALCVTELQRAGGKRLPVKDFIVGGAILVGMQFNTHLMDAASVVNIPT